MRTPFAFIQDQTISIQIFTGSKQQIIPNYTGYGCSLFDALHPYGHLWSEFASYDSVQCVSTAAGTINEFGLRITLRAPSRKFVHIFAPRSPPGHMLWMYCCIESKLSKTSAHGTKLHCRSRNRACNICLRLGGSGARSKYFLMSVCLFWS